MSGPIGDDVRMSWHLRIMGLLLYVGVTLSAGEAGELATLLNPVSLPFTVRSDISGEGREAVAVKHQGTDFAWERFGGYGIVRAFHNDQHELHLGVSATRTWIDSDATLNTGEAIPQRLDDVSGSLAYRYFVGGGCLVGATMRLGSASDDIFSHADVYDVGATCFIRLPVRTRDAWIFSLVYANDRPRLNHIPLPGVLYQWLPDDTLMVMAGFPIAMVMWKPVKPLAVDAFASVFGSAKAGVSWLPFAPIPIVRARLGWEWGSETYKQADREDNDDQLLFRDMRIAATLDVSPLRALTIGLRAAWLFEREIFVGEGAADDSDAVSLDSGWLFGAALTARF